MRKLEYLVGDAVCAVGLKGLWVRVWSEKVTEYEFDSP
jgi:hypothetical protein